MSMFRRRLLMYQALMNKSGNIVYPGLIAAWSAAGKTNDDEDRATLCDLTGNGHDITLNGFAFSEMSGYGGYRTDFTKWYHNQAVVKMTKTNTAINIIEFITGSGVSFASISSFSGTIKFRISGLIDEIDLRCKTTAEDGTQTQNKLSNGEYNFDNYGYISFICLSGYIGECNIIIEQIPEYPGALVFDGVNDYGINENMPIQTDYTVILKADNFTKSICGIITKDRFVSYTTAAFNLRQDKLLSFGADNIMQYPNGIVYFSKNNYNGTAIKSGNFKDIETINIGCIRAGSYYSNMIFYCAYLFDRSLDEQEIKAFIRKYIDPEYLLPSEIEAINNSLVAKYECYDKTNDDADRDVLADLSGNGRDIQLYNFAFNEESGYKDKALISDGVDDYGVCFNFPKLPISTGYTIFAIRTHLNNVDKSIAAKSIITISGEFQFEFQYNNVNIYIRNYGGQSNILYNQNLFSYMTSNTYNGITISKGASVNYADDLYLFANRSGSIGLKAKLWALEIYDRDLTDEEIAAVKSRMIKTYEEKTGNKYVEEVS